MTEDPKSYVIPLAKGMILSGQEWAALFYYMNEGRPIPRPLRRRMWRSGLIWRVGARELLPVTTQRMMIEQAPRSPWRAPVDRQPLSSYAPLPVGFYAAILAGSYAK